MPYRWCALFVACAAASAFQKGDAPSADAARRADVYAIYSVLLTNPETSHGPDDNEIYLIEGTTVPGSPREPCVRAPAGHAARFAEVLADFERRQDMPSTLERALQITKPYRLLNGDGVQEFIAAHTSPGAPKVSDLFRLSNVYFDRDRTLALTAISTWCGDGLCGLFSWKLLEKTKDGSWSEIRSAGCSAIAQAVRSPAESTGLRR